MHLQATLAVLAALPAVLAAPRGNFGGFGNGKGHHRGGHAGTGGVAQPSGSSAALPVPSSVGLAVAAVSASVPVTSCKKKSSSVAAVTSIPTSKSCKKSSSIAAVTSVTVTKSCKKSSSAVAATSVPAEPAEPSSTAAVAASSTLAVVVAPVSSVVASATSTATSAVATSAVATAVATTAAGDLNDLAIAAGKSYFGTSWDIVDAGELDDTAYMAMVNDSSLFGMITPGNVQKWEFTEQSQGVFDYTDADQQVAIALANGQQVRCHNLVWYNELPSWLTGGTWTNETLIAVMQNHITNLVTHFGNDCYAWDVVNEALADGGGYRDNLFYETIGEAYVPIAFQAAQDAIAVAGLTTKLYYNDYNIEYSGTKATEALALVTDIQNRGIQIDGVGLQGHFIVGSTPSQSDQTTILKSYTALGLEVAQTEVDIRFSALPPTTAQLTQQETDYKSTVAACVAVEGCVGTTIWGFTDKYSWIPSTFSGQGEALPYDTELAPKPAYTGIVDALTSA